ncbi:MAG: DUF2796 domain-containing protein, partial [Hyphomicrobiaceae bacterium]
HEHGHGAFNVAIDGRRVSMELEAPGADIVAFEHKPTTKRQETAVASAKSTLSDLAKVIKLPEAAGCVLQNATVELHVADRRDGDQKPEASTGTDTTHTEFFAAYDVVCTSPTKITWLAFPYFDTFPRAQELDVSIVGPKSQKKFDVGRDNARIELSGIN